LDSATLWPAYVTTCCRYLFNGKPKASARCRDADAFGLPLNELGSRLTLSYPSQSSAVQLGTWLKQLHDNFNTSGLPFQRKDAKSQRFTARPNRKYQFATDLRG
jgi:hypothetical protein